MGEVERRRRRELAPRHIPHVDVPIPIGEAREFLRDALRGTSIVDPVARLITSRWMFEPHVRFTELDEGSTRIELDMTALTPGAMSLLYPARRAEIDRFFIAIDDELDRRRDRESRRGIRD
jgi:hypothetical protein